MPRLIFESETHRCGIRLQISEKIREVGRKKTPNRNPELEKNV
jgi:hypothetical protein